MVYTHVNINVFISSAFKLPICLEDIGSSNDIIGEHSTKTTMAAGTEKSLFNYPACI